MRHTLYWERDSAETPDPVSGALITIVGDEALHAVKSKRLREGDGCRACDGRGLVLLSVVERATKSRVELRIERAQRVPPIAPSVEIVSATPKGPRLDKMLDMLAQCGTASWGPLRTQRGVVEPGAHKRERAGRIAIEALKQSGRAHVMTIEEERTLEEAMTFEGALLVAESGGTPPSGLGLEEVPRVRVLVGPEGGLTSDELATIEAAGGRRLGLGPCVLRIETACVLAAGGLLAHAASPETRGSRA